MGKEVIITVTTTATKLLDVMPLRKEYSIQNQGSVMIYLGISDQVATSGTRKGRQLAPNGIEDANKDDNPELISLPLYAIAESGTCTVWVWEA